MKSLGRLRSFCILLTLWLIVFTSASQFLIIVPILPRLTESLGFSKELGGTLVGIYGLMVGLSALLAGPISDRFGRVLVLRIGSGFMAFSLLLHYMVWDFGSMLWVRALAGCSSGFMAGGSVAYIGDLYPYERRGVAMGWLMSGMAFGQIIGIPMGTLLAAAGGFRLPFVILGALMCVAFVMTFFALLQPDVQRSTSLNVRSLISRYVHLMRQPDIAGVNLAGMLMMFGLSSFVVYLPAWLEVTMQASMNDLALLFFLGGMAQAASSPAAGWLSDRVGRKLLIVMGCVGVSIFFALTPFVTQLWMMKVIFPLGMIFVALRIVPLRALLTALTDAQSRGALMSLHITCNQVGFATGGVLAGWLYLYGYALSAWVAACSGLVAAGVLIWWVPEPNILGKAKGNTD